MIGREKKVLDGDWDGDWENIDVMDLELQKNFEDGPTRMSYDHLMVLPKYQTVR